MDIWVNNLQRFLHNCRYDVKLTDSSAVLKYDR
jgi:hypothetical protein